MIVSEEVKKWVVNFPPGYDDTGTFVAANEGKLGGYWSISVDSVEISMADSGVFDVNENFIWAGLGDCNDVE
ncbi:MAG: hypothetical protein LQ343_002330 [Gyalolechia ehrenbergii]|nr:MAG: hypothetical protein LQ343_002330 [Gyalolechia ehrenbergii]